MAFDPQELKKRARDNSGLHDFGAAPFEESLQILCKALATEAQLSAEGTAKAEALLTEHLMERLRLEDYIRRHPDVLEDTLAPAIFLVGMPRSGTTALAQHLSEDPALRSIPRWESKRLTPPDQGAWTDCDPRIMEIKAEFEAAFQDMPWRQKILPNNYDDPAEHGLLMALTFLNLQWPTLFHVPSWTEWILKQDMRAGYEYLARVLKVLQRAKPAQRWSLKLPPDLFVLENIAQAFPDALFVWAHRHPVEAISSVCSLCAQVREKQYHASIDPQKIGPEQMEFQALGVDRALSARARLGDARFIDVWQSDLSRDMLGTLSDLYAKLGLEMSAAYRDNLTKRMQEKPRGRFGTHEHELEAYGLTEAMVAERFAPYIARFHA